MNNPIDPAEAPAGSGDAAAADAPTAAVRQLHPRPAACPTALAAGAPVARLSSYRRTDTRGSRWRFTGRVEHVTGEPAERLRGELAVVVRDLLAWATEHRAASDVVPVEAQVSQAGQVENGEAA